MRSRTPETEEGTWCRKLQWGYCSAGRYFGVRNSRVEGGCFDPREPCNQQPCIKAKVPNRLRSCQQPAQNRRIIYALMNSENLVAPCMAVREMKKRLYTWRNEVGALSNA
jgi:hypothetical protein